jgi:hypothetical protein
MIVWQVAQGWPVWRANEGRALAGEGASERIAKTSQAETTNASASELGSHVRLEKAADI